MEIISVSLHDLRKMNNSEALILQGCGGDLKEWVDAIRYADRNRNIAE